MESLVYGFADDRSGVIKDGVIEPLGETWLELPHLGLRSVGEVQGVRVWQRKHADADGRLAVPPYGHVLVSGAQLGSGDILEGRDLPIGAGLEDDGGGLVGRDQHAPSAP